MVTYSGIEMNLVQSIAALPNRAGSNHITAAQLPVPSIARQRYCITARCNVDHADAVERLMRHELGSPGISVEHIKSDGQCRHMTRVATVLMCTAHARSVLFRLVNRLGLHAGVRAICWETVPSAATRSAAHRFGDPATQTLSATTRTPERDAGTGQ
jgi:hypothetical protein